MIGERRRNGSVTMEKASSNNDPLTIVDIGASGGIHARWSGLPCGLRAVLFEPDPREFDNLTSMAPDNWTVINAALSDRSGDIEFRLARKQQVSSVYPPNRAFPEKFPDPERFHTVKTIKIRADTLDNQLKINLRCVRRRRRGRGVLGDRPESGEPVNSARQAAGRRFRPAGRANGHRP